MKTITQELVNEIRTGLSFGLCKGLGSGKPGDMCVEHLICQTLGEGRKDYPSCVISWLAGIKQKLNDHPNHKDNFSRAKVMERIAIAQLGSLNLDHEKFFNLLWLKTHQKILPNIINQRTPNSIFISKFSATKDLVEFKKIWLEFKVSSEYNYYYYYNYNYNYYYYYYYEGILQDIADILVECCVELGTEGSKYL